MPSVFQPPDAVPSTTPWAATTAYTAGQNVQPSPLTGQYFQAQGNGTSGSTQPAWSTSSALPIPGTTFVDGTVTWTCMGSLYTESQVLALDMPLDSDTAVVTVIGRALRNLGNYVTNGGLLNVANVWTAVNTFSAGAIIDVALNVPAIRSLAPAGTVEMGWTSGGGSNFVFNGGLQILGNTGGVGYTALGPTWSVAGTSTLPNSVPYFVKNTTGGAQIITLPSLPVAGHTIVIFQSAIGTLTVIAPGGVSAPLINGSAGATGVTISSQYAALTFYWDDVSNQWWAWS